MKIKIGSYDVEITATNRYAKEDCDEMYLLNKISIWASEAALYNKYVFGDDDISDVYEHVSHEIFLQLLDAGFYDSTGLFPERGKTSEK